MSYIPYSFVKRLLDTQKHQLVIADYSGRKTPLHVLCGNEMNCHRSNKESLVALFVKSFAKAATDVDSEGMYPLACCMQGQVHLVYRYRSIGKRCSSSRPVGVSQPKSISYHSHCPRKAGGNCALLLPVTPNCRESKGIGPVRIRSAWDAIRAAAPGSKCHSFTVATCIVCKGRRYRQ
jgi:hypothetical protein